MIEIIEIFLRTGAIKLFTQESTKILNEIQTHSLNWMVTKRIVVAGIISKLYKYLHTSGENILT